VPAFQNRGDGSDRNARIIVIESDIDEFNTVCLEIEVMQGFNMKVPRVGNIPKCELDKHRRVRSETGQYELIALPVD
jgi:hypothetical protein